jgi:hypothetical protein
MKVEDTEKTKKRTFPLSFIPGSTEDDEFRLSFLLTTLGVVVW